MVLMIVLLASEDPEWNVMKGEVTISRDLQEGLELLWLHKYLFIIFCRTVLMLRKGTAC